MASESPRLGNPALHPSPVDDSATPAADSAKRKADHPGGTHTRTKRNRYISIAWYDSVLPLMIN